MSKDYPEIGDLWIDKENPDLKIYIYDFGDGYFPNEFRGKLERLVCDCYEIDIKNNISKMSIEFVSEIQKYYNFIGKSETKVFDLFKPIDDSDAKLILKILLKNKPDLLDWAKKNFSYLLNEGETK